MELWDVINVALTVVVTLAATSAIVLPFFTTTETAGDASNSETKEKSALLSKKEQLLSSLVELEEEFIARKIDDATYTESKKQLSQQAAHCVEKLAKLP